MMMMTTTHKATLFSLAVCLACSAASSVGAHSAPGSSKRVAAFATSDEKSDEAPFGQSAASNAGYPSEARQLFGVYDGAYDGEAQCPLKRT